MRLTSRIAIGVVLGAALTQSALGQNPPVSAAQIQALQSRPDMATQVRQRIGASGLSADQIRARLRAAGYPENLLDSYLTGRGDSAAAPGADVFAAIRSLGIADSADVASLLALQGLQRPPRRPVRIDPAATSDPTLSSASAVIFGLSLFGDANTQFVPDLQGPVDPSYRLGPGDRLVLILTGDVELAYPLEVTREGFVVIPQVGQIQVANLTLSQLDDLLYVRLGRVYSGVRRTNPSTHFNVSVSSVRAIQVIVAGDAVTPGTLKLSAAGTALTALYAAGGPTETGSLRRIQVRRAGREALTLDLYEFLLRGDKSADVRLEQGDVVFIPVHGPRVRVDGEVTRPATYELRSGETLSDVLAAAGGFRATAGQRRVVIDRIIPASARANGGADRATIDVPMGTGGAVPPFELADGDVVRVPGIADRVRDRIVVNGNVWSSGVQGFTPGLTLEQALRRAGGVKSDVYLGQVSVSRLRPDSTRVQLRVALRDTTGATLQPFPLESFDEITVFSRTTFRPEHYVAVTGAVRRPGQYQWREGMTLRDLLLTAGGLPEAAYLVAAEIARVPESRAPGELARTISVPLDSSYLFDRPGLERRGSEVVLQPYDNVLISRAPDWSPPRTVIVMGEVKFPGRYTLVTKTDRLSDVIARAHGVTAAADVEGAYFTRMHEATAYRAPVDSMLLLSDSSRRGTDEGRIRVGVDLAAALKKRGIADDLILENGDSLFIPAQRQTVEIRGEVNAPTALVYMPGRSLGSYVDAAGGPTQRANSRRAYVIQPNGKIESRSRFFWIFTSDPTPRAGATVVVPMKDLSQQPGNALATVATVAQVLASLAAIIVVSR